MLEIKNKTNNSFFESVANHNLERFHSEVIAWTFNTFPDVAKEFITSVNTAKPVIKDEIQDLKCEAEICQIDIKLEYKIRGITHSIFIENKLKATEHKISHKIWSKNLQAIINSDLLKKHNEEEKEISQTEYYFLRHKNEFPDSNCHFIYLVPNRVNPDDVFNSNINSSIREFYNFEKLNIWSLEIENPWITITYKKLTDWLGSYDLFKTNNEENKIIAVGYINYLKGDKFSEYIDLNNYNNNVFGRFEYFKLLLATVKSKFENVNVLNSIVNDHTEDSVYEYVMPGSSNGGMPLFAFYKKIQLDKKYTFFSDNDGKSKAHTVINIGIQVQGESFKYYVSADEYGNTKVKHNNSTSIYNYEPFVKEVLKKISDDFTEKDSIVDFSKYKNGGFNPNKTKTFYSRSYKITKFIENKNPNNNKVTIEGIRDVFDIANEISKKVNHFISFDINQTISNYENDIKSQ